MPPTYDPAGPDFVVWFVDNHPHPVTTSEILDAARHRYGAIKSVTLADWVHQCLRSGRITQAGYGLYTSVVTGSGTPPQDGRVNGLRLAADAVTDLPDSWQWSHAPVGKLAALLHPDADVAALARHHDWPATTIEQILQARAAISAITGQSPSKPRSAPWPAPRPYTPPTAAALRRDLERIPAGQLAGGGEMFVGSGNTLIATPDREDATNLLHCLIGGILGTADAVAWVADSTGGALLQPWLHRVALNGELHVIDWPAIGSNAIAGMLETARTVARARRQRAADGRPWTPHDEDPEIFVVLDLNIFAKVGGLLDIVLPEIQRLVSCNEGTGVNLILSMPNLNHLGVAVRNRCNYRFAGFRRDAYAENDFLYGEVVDEVLLPGTSRHFLTQGPDRVIRRVTVPDFDVPGHANAVCEAVSGRTASLDRVADEGLHIPLYEARFGATGLRGLLDRIANS